MYIRSMENNTTQMENNTVSFTKAERTILIEFFLDCMAEIDGEFFTAEVQDHYTFALDALDDSDLLDECLDLMPECLRDLETALALA